MRARVAVPSGFRAAARTIPEPFAAISGRGNLDHDDAENSAVNCCAEGPSRGVAGPSEPRNPLHMAVSPRLKKGNLDQGDKVLSTATSRDTSPIGRRHAATAILALPPSFQRRRDQGFPVRLSENQTRKDIRKNITAANGSGIVRATARKPKGTATRARLILGVDSIDAANRLCRSGAICNAEIFEAEPYNEAIRPRQCYSCHKFGHIAAFCSATAQCGRCSAAKHPSEQECPALHGMVREKCPNCYGPDSVPWPTCSGRRPDRPIQTGRGNSPTSRKTTTLSPEGRRSAGDDLSPEASTRKRSYLVLSRPPAPAGRATTPTNTQPSTQ
ncbi:hypothetical protein E4U24_004620 [Claviceps purpurea]|nr:hypothetical protein E4U24_004620 [Claviceps purpurea]